MANASFLNRESALMSLILLLIYQRYPFSFWTYEDRNFAGKSVGIFNRFHRCVAGFENIARTSDDGKRVRINRLTGIDGKLIRSNFDGNILNTGNRRGND